MCKYHHHRGRTKKVTIMYLSMYVYKNFTDAYWQIQCCTVPSKEVIFSIYSIHHKFSSKSFKIFFNKATNDKEIKAGFILRCKRTDMDMIQCK